MDKKIILLIALLFPLLTVRGATCTSTVSGFWNNPTTWSCGQVPTCGDSIVVPAGVTVTVSTQLNMVSCSPVKITVKGNLYFINGKKLDLPCNSRIHVYPGGTISSDGSGNSNLISACNVTYWDGSMGTFYGPGCIPPSTACIGAILPIELISFTAEQCERDVCIKWKTATEHNSSHFVVERTYDALTWTPIQQVKAMGESLRIVNYSVTDPNVRGTVYYRLTQFDFDGTFERFPIVVIDVERTDPAFYPNPNDGNVTMPKLSHVVVADMFGNVLCDVLTDRLSLDAPAGSYVLTINGHKHKMNLIR